MLKVVIARMVYGGWARDEITDWQTFMLIGSGKGSYSAVGTFPVNRLDVPTARNQACRKMIEVGADAVCMVDADMEPSVGFLEAAAACLKANPCGIVMSPYLSGWPNYEVQIRVDGPGVYRRLGVPDLQSALQQKGVQECTGGGTGLCLVDRRAFELLEAPQFEYGYDPDTQDVVATEDTVFCRKLMEKGGRCWVDWDHWSIHWKPQRVGPPEKIDVGTSKANGAAPDAVHGGPGPGVGPESACPEPPGNGRGSEQRPGGAADPLLRTPLAV